MQQESSSDPGNLELFPPNPRVSFLLSQRDDLRNWAYIPVYIGFLLAPLYDHRDAFEQVLVGVSILASSWVWGRFFQGWMDSRIGIWKVPVMNKSKPVRNHWRAIQTFAAISLFIMAFAFLRRDSPDFSPHGWIERGVGTWLVTAIVICAQRAFEPVNPRERRICNGVAAAILLVSLGFIGISQQSYAYILILIGLVNLCLALLDVRLLARFAATPSFDESGQAHV